MARWALSAIVGTGTGDDPFRARASGYGSHVALIAANADGTPKGSWCLVRLADDADLVAAQADNDLRVLPNWTMDHAITAGEATAIASALARFSIIGYPDPAGRTVRQIVRWLADRLDITWDVG